MLTKKSLEELLRAVEKPDSEIGLLVKGSTIKHLVQTVLHMQEALETCSHMCNKDLVEWSRCEVCYCLEKWGVKDA